MNWLACLSMATGLVVSNSFPATCEPLNCSYETLYASKSTGLLTVDPVTPVALPPVYFCGESVPLHEEKVARHLVKALVSNSAHQQLLYQIRQRAATFFPVIEPILAQHNVPLDFKYLPLVESALRGYAVSPSGAAGYWQFMPATARELGLRVGGGHDERRDLVKSTEAACRYLNYLYSRLGSWTLAAAAYNNGLGALLGNIRRQQQRDYYYLRLSAETGKYLYRILAFKELFSNHHSYKGLISDRVLASLSRPVSPESDASGEDILLPERFVDEAVEVAVRSGSRESGGVEEPADIPLPNAADVFRGGIKARLAQAAGLQRGQVWVFHLTRDGMTDGKAVEAGDILYATVEDVDSKTGKVFLRADRLYSAGEKQTYSLALAAVDASTGRIGIKLTDVDQIKAGWILTWKVL